MQPYLTVLLRALSLSVSPVCPGFFSTNVGFFGNNAHGNNNSMLAGLKHQFSHQFMADAEFNWSKSMDNSSAPYAMQFYPYDPSLSYGRSDYNVGKAFKLYGLYQPVFFHGSHAWLEKVAGGWSISGIFNRLPRAEGQQDICGL
jgi:hypothetical protein